MLSSMTPTLLLDDAGKVTLVIGTPGSTIFTSVFQVMVNLLDFGMSPEDAVAATRFHHQLYPDLITHSGPIPLSEAVKAELAKLGYRTEKHLWEFGDVQVIVRGSDGWQAASDPRGRVNPRYCGSRPGPARPGLAKINYPVMDNRGARKGAVGHGMVTHIEKESTFQPGTQASRGVPLSSKNCRSPPPVRMPAAPWAQT